MSRAYKSEPGGFRWVLRLQRLGAREPIVRVEGGGGGRAGGRGRV